MKESGILLTRGRRGGASDLSMTVVLSEDTRDRCNPEPRCSERGLDDDVAYRMSADIRLTEEQTPA